MNLLSMIKDLVLSTQVRAACEAAGIKYLSGRTNEKFEKVIQEIKPSKVVIDLNIEGADPFKAIESALVSVSPGNILCFYSHVNVELAEKAFSLGLNEEQVLRRSQFFNNLNEILC